MKYSISENKFSTIVTKYLDELYDVNDINATSPYEYDDETGEEFEDNNVIDFYRGDYDGPYDSDFCFRWIDPEYYGEDFYKALYDQSPILEVHDKEGETLEAYFGNKWKEPFKIWFQENFELPVKTVKVGIS